MPAYFDAFLDAQAPERFSIKFLENLGFTSTNDRLFIGVLKDLGFLNRDGAPQPRYFDFLDRSRSKQVLAEAIRDSFSDLFAINMRAHDFTYEDAKNKLRTLYAGRKTDLVVGRIAKTFRALCDYADFQGILAQPPVTTSTADETREPTDSPASPPGSHEAPGAHTGLLRSSTLQYHINIVLPETRDQAVYDAIFKSLRNHLG